MRVPDLRLWLAVALCAAAAAPVTARAAVPGGTPLVLADFDGDAAAGPPAGWKTRADAARASRIYQVIREGGQQYLHAAARAESVQIGLPVAFRLREYPLLSWRWRVAELPDGADEREAATNDSAAGVYVVFRGGFAGLLPRAIKYVWSARAPRGTAMPSPHYPNARIVVLESGTADRGAWKTETVDVAGDYRRLFRSEPPDPQGIALLTDADDTRSHAVADYDDFRALAARASRDDASDVARRVR